MNTASGIQSGVWLLVAIPAVSAAILLLGGKATNAWGHLLGTLAPLISFAFGVVLFMCIELMLNAANLALVTFSRINGTLDGQIMAFFVMVVAAAEVVVGLAIIMAIFRTRRSASVDDTNLLKY